MAMSMSSGNKSLSSVAAMLLVAVVAASCASFAEAHFNITNLCNKTIVITTETGASTLPPGGGLQVDVPPNNFFTGPVTFTITGTCTPPVTVIIQVPQIVLNQLNELGVELQKIEIKCEGNCVTIKVTYKIPRPSHWVPSAAL